MRFFSQHTWATRARNAYGDGGDAYLVKTDANGNMQWSRTYGSSTIYGLVQTSDAGYALTGYIDVGGARADLYLLKTDVIGYEQWNITYGGSDDDLAESVVQTNDGGFAIAGYTQSFGIMDFWLVKTDASGNVGGVESGLAWIDSSANTVTLYRGATDTSWNYARVRLWKPR
jgi:hypothetical protein